MGTTQGETSMRLKRVILILFVFLVALLLSACLGEPAFPLLETAPASTFPAPMVDPTIAVLPRRDLNLGNQQMISNVSIPQISHDLIGRSDCLMCHKQGMSGAPRLSDIHLGLASNTCQTCHTAPTSVELSGVEIYSQVCSRCHGENGEGGVGPAINIKPYLQSVTDEELRRAIVRGRGVGEMLAWGNLGLLTDNQIEELVTMIRAWEPTAPEQSGPITAKPANATLGDPENGKALFAQFCTGCHGLHGETAVGDGFILRQVVGSLDDATIARGIRDGGEGMPPFHAMFVSDDINNLLALIRTWSMSPEPTPTAIALSGEEMFSRVCARCHGQDGEGGIAPPLNSKEFLDANGDEAIRQWIVRGTLGTSMLSWGDLGLLTSEQVDRLVAFIRSWEPTSTVGESTAAQHLDAKAGDITHGQQLFAQFCSGCHGLEGERQTGGIILNSAAFLSSVNDEIIGSQILNGGRKMPSFHAVLTRQEVNDLLAFMRAGFTAMDTIASPSFSKEVMPILVGNCALCHGTAGGWSTGTYDEVVNSGLNAPVIIPGDAEGSLFVQKLRGTQTIGGSMPPGVQLPPKEIDLIIRWITAGAPDN